MKIVERRIQRLENGKWEEYLARERRFDAIEQRLGGFPPKRYARVIAGADEFGAVVWARNWDSFASMEAAYERLSADPEMAAASAIAGVLGERIEYMQPLDGILSNNE
jgi:hypothetical protein